MEGWLVGLIVMMAVGVTVIVFGALWDRTRNRRLGQQMLSPPQRPIPHFDPQTPQPQYLSELQARRSAPATDAALDEETRHRLRTAIKDVEPLPIGYASADFVTDPATGWAVAQRPRVLVCTHHIPALREILPALEAVQLSPHPLVLVAPGFDPEVLATLEVNRLQHLVEVVAVVAGDGVREVVAQRCGATPVDAFDLKAGYLPGSAYGSIAWWISDQRRTWLLTDGGTGDRGPQGQIAADS